MRLKRLKLSALLLSGLGLTGLQAQTIYVKQINGTQTAYALSSVRKMTFSSGNFNVTKIDNSSGWYALSGLRYLKFSDVSTGINESLIIQGGLISYPNPASDVLNIDLSGTAQQEGTVSVFNFEGKAVLSRKVIHAGILSLDISHLPAGIYLCRYINHTEIRTVKIIKQ